MIPERFFCAAASRANGESIYGTVARIRSWLLLEYPDAWRRHAIQDSPLLSERVKGHIRDLKKLGVIERAILIRREHSRSGPLHSFFVHSCDEPPRMLQALLHDYEDLPAVTSAEPTRGLMFAVCTHGRHDKCCAKFGLPVFCAFRDQVGGRAWQCSHIGGDRFAGNVVVFPHGIYYGRVRPDDVLEIIRRSEQGEIWLPLYRGRSCFPRAVQVAEYFLRCESGRLGIEEFKVLTVVRSASGLTQVAFQSRTDGTLHVVEFNVTAERLEERLTCASMELSLIPRYQLLRYVVTA